MLAGPVPAREVGGCRTVSALVGRLGCTDGCTAKPDVRADQRIKRALSVAVKPSGLTSVCWTAVPVALVLRAVGVTQGSDATAALQRSRRLSAGVDRCR
jgi:hypothetical protein